jgi:diketogulonate reductase-like aldo/keto reductase
MSPQEAFDSVLFALQQGYRHIDTAHLYGNEQAVGIYFFLAIFPVYVVGNF